MIGTHFNESLDPIHIPILGKVSGLRDLLLYMLQFTYLGPFYSVIPPSHRVSLSSRSNKKKGIEHTEGTFISWKPWSQSGTYHFYSNLVRWWLVRWLVQGVIKAWVGFPGGAVVENLPANAGHTGSSPGLGRSHMPRSN